MKSGGPWNLRGLRPETREAAREAARQAGMSVGEWLNSVIRTIDDDDYGEPMRFAEYDDEDWRDDYRPRYREPRRRRPQERGAALAREEIGEVHARLDRLTQQLERMAQVSTRRLTGAPGPAMRGRPPPLPRSLSGKEAEGGPVTVDDAIAQIAERQRALYGNAAPGAAGVESSAPEQAAEAAAPAVSPEHRSAPPVDISNLEDQLQYLTQRIEALRPNGELEQAVKAVRRDLTEIRRQLGGAMPRRDVETLENEVQDLAERIDRSRDGGVDAEALAAVEGGLAEIREALAGLTPAENLVGFDEALKGLSQKVDRIIAKEDPAALQQLETAIGALRGIVAHVASNDTLNKVAEEVRLLGVKVDALAGSAASGAAVSALESRVDSLASALNASADAGHTVPHELEKLLTGLIEKLEWVQLTHTDHAALAQLEDRIAQLVKRLDASDARLGNLGAVERGLADLLVHIDRIGAGTAAPVDAAKPAVDAIERDVAAIKLSDRRTQDSLEAVHGAVEQVVDRLAMIESGINSAVGKAESLIPMEAGPGIVPAAEPEPLTAVPAPPPPAEPAPRPASPPRPPIDPHLPPDHPLEPGSTPVGRTMPSVAERIAASEAAVEFAKPPVIAEPGDKPNFIAAARRAAQAAAAAPSERTARADGTAKRLVQSPTPSRLRKLLVAGGAVLIVFGCVHIALHMLQERAASGNGAAVAPSPPPAPPPTVVPETNSAAPPQSGPLVLPVPGAASDAGPANGPQNQVPAVTSKPPPAANPGAAAPTNPERQSALPDATDITGALPRVPPPSATPAPTPTETSVAAPSAVFEKLPATIGGPKLRAAAMAGDATAEFEVATRFAEGRGVMPSNELAARWLDRAAKQGLAPAQFRLGGFYEKGIGVKKDLAAARELYAAAAAKGNGKAMHNLAVLYAEGINGPADYRTAALWFHKAADRGVADSQYNLAILYARGIGVEQNYAESYQWFALAADQGDNEAAKKRDEVAAHLDAQALAAAKLAVAKWSAVPQPEDAVTVKAPPGGWDLPDHANRPKPRSADGKAEKKSGQASL